MNLNGWCDDDVTVRTHVAGQLDLLYGSISWNRSVNVVGFCQPATDSIPSECQRTAFKGTSSTRTIREVNEVIRSAAMKCLCKLSSYVNIR